MDDKFTLIDLNSWARAQTYEFYTEHVTPTSFSISVDMDVTILRQYVKNKGLKFFPSCVYLISWIITSSIEFRLGVKDGELGYYNCLHPQYSVFHEDNKTFSLLWTEYKKDFHEFYQDYIKDCEKYGQEHSFITSKGNAPENSYIISCSPWISFNSISIHMQDVENYLVPMFILGGFKNENGRVKMPVSITINHAAADGYHIQLLLNEIQNMMNHPEEWIGR